MWSSGDKIEKKGANQMYEHTIGPWRADGWKIIGGDNSVIAKVVPWDETGGRREGVANLNVFLAAPDLLEMVIRLQVAFGQFCCDHCVTEQDLEDEGDDILEASRAADELLKRVAPWYV
jgi:hypothetical protein